MPLGFARAAPPSGWVPGAPRADLEPLRWATLLLLLLRGEAGRALPEPRAVFGAVPLGAIEPRWMRRTHARPATDRDSKPQTGCGFTLRRRWVASVPTKRGNEATLSSQFHTLYVETCSGHPPPLLAAESDALLASLQPSLRAALTSCFSREPPIERSSF